MLERIKTESEYIRGFHLYLTDRNCYKIKLLRVFITTNYDTYSKFIFENTKEYLEQFKNKKEIILIENNDQPSDYWLFDKTKYKEKLNNDLPIDNFFEWCEQAIKEDVENFSFDDFFMLTCLLFEEDYEVSVSKEAKQHIVATKDTELVMPKLQIKKQKYVS